MEEGVNIMSKIKILAGGSTKSAQANARGKLFEKMISEVLRHYGYNIDRIPSTNYAGMEIDIEGTAIATGISLYAECKCYETELDSSKLQAFFGKYMTRWFNDKRCQGLFVAIPGVNSHAKGFYKDNMENNREFTIKILDENDVLQAVLGSELVISPQLLNSRVEENEWGIAGEWILLYTDKGIYWIQYVIQKGEGIPTSLVVFDNKANIINDKSLIEYISDLYPEIADYNILTMDKKVDKIYSIQDFEEIVEVRGSSECFEYQFPASPEYFVGRNMILEELDNFAGKIVRKETSSRSLLFEANSGWGKSSAVLASVARLNEKGHFAIAIDSRSASSSQFILRVAEYVVSKFNIKEGLLSEHHELKTLTGFDGAVKAIASIGKSLEERNKVLFVFLDQFENVFFLQDALKRIRDLSSKLADISPNVVFGFSWKTDLIVGASEFPYHLRDEIISSSFRFSLKPFAIEETDALLNKLSQEIKAPLRKDLKFFLSEFSQGYPWLLKKLCAHVKYQRSVGVPQSEMADSLLNVEELFQEDLRGLSSIEEDALRRIAKLAPISIMDLGEEFSSEVVQSLVNSRLIVRVGNKYDIYWDIFRDYLNTNNVPAQENYILRQKFFTIHTVCRILAEANSILPVNEVIKRASLTEGSFKNISRDMRLLGLTKFIDDDILLSFNFSKNPGQFDESFRNHLRERLRRNRIVIRILESLELYKQLNLQEIADLLEKACPYISATSKTWESYAKTFTEWMDEADLLLLDKRKGVASRYQPQTEVREKVIINRGYRGGVGVPQIQYKPSESAVIRVAEALERNNRIDWSGFKKSTVAKALITLEDIGFIIRKPNSIEILPKGLSFVNQPDNRAQLIAESILKIPVFNTFFDILEAHKEEGLKHTELACILRERMQTNWSDSTAAVNVKILLDWARHAKLAPGVFAYNRRSK